MLRNNEREDEIGRGSDQRNRKGDRGEEGRGGEGWMGIQRENPLELVIRLALLLYF